MNVSGPFPAQGVVQDGHLDLLELDAARAGSAAAGDRAHLEGCARCRAELEWFGRAASRIARAAVPPAPRRRRWIPLSAAAGLLLTIGLWIASRPGYALEDIDRSGRVDILDAYGLALRIRKGEREPRWDLSGDGVIDARDVETLARPGGSMLQGKPSAPVASRGEPPRFVALDVYVDTGGKPLAAWQFELAGAATIVGVEGGEAPFREAPHYDPAALQGGRIVVAAFTLDPNPPGGRVRIARLHMEERGVVDYAPRLIAAGAPGGGRLEAKIEIVRTGGK